MGAATDVPSLGAELQDSGEACDHSGVMQQVLVKGSVKGGRKMSPSKRPPGVTQAPSWVVSGQREERWQSLVGNCCSPSPLAFHTVEGAC